jgi:hypothetical protein
MIRPFWTPTLQRRRRGHSVLAAAQIRTELLEDRTLLSSIAGRDIGRAEAPLPGSTSPAPGEGIEAGPIFINEILFNSAGADTGNEYIELRGTASSTIAAGTYFVGIEGDGTGGGVVDFVYDLGGLTFGGNGFLLLLQRSNPYAGLTDPASTVATSSGTAGWQDPRVSINGAGTDLENGSQGYFVIETMTAPTTGTDLDTDSNGELDAAAIAGWTILDQVGVADSNAVSEAPYASLVFAPGGGSMVLLPPGATVVDTGTTVPAYVGRQGNSTGSMATDWVGGSVDAGQSAPNSVLGTAVPGTFSNRPLDHLGSINFQQSDFGDAPDSYGTLAGSSGASHGSGGALLGTLKDLESNGKPTAAADGDSLANDADEDGVTIPLFTDGLASMVSVTVNGVGAGATVQGWFDWNDNGAFEVGEMAINQAVAADGTIMVSVTAPVGSFAATGGTTYARLRVSAAGGLTPTGAAADGEVEDYTVVIQSATATDDFGDAPDTYGTTLAASGARHTAAGPALGPTVDTEANGAPSSTATGDDTAGIDDEDGATFTSALVPGSMATVRVTAPSAGVLDAWVDFNINGTFDVGEQVFTDTVLGVGTNDLSFAVPGGAVLGSSFARFRIASAAGDVTGPTGAAPNGEVEDHAVAISPQLFLNEVLFNPPGADETTEYVELRGTPGATIPSGTYLVALEGDVPANAGDVQQIFDLSGLTLGSNGFLVLRHNGSLYPVDPASTVVTGTGLGFFGAAGFQSDDASGNFEQTSVTFMLLHASVAPTLSNDIDTDNNGIPDGVFTTNQWIVRDSVSVLGLADPSIAYGQIVFSEMAAGTVPAGATVVDTLTLAVDYVGRTGDTTGSAAADWVGSELDPAFVPPEVRLGSGAGETFPMSLDGRRLNHLGASNFPAISDDFGDAPASYGTLLANDGARHEATGVTLGPTRDADDGAFPTAAADGDDTNSTDDEDGVTLPMFIEGISGSVSIALAGVGGGATVQGWFDWNDNGIFEAGEMAVNQAVAVDGTIMVSVTAPAGSATATGGTTFARFRVSAAGGLLPTGRATTGEVEDYTVAIQTAAATDDFGDAPDTYGTTLAASGARHTGMGPTLGPVRDIEADGQPGATATGDDSTGSDDEDGVSIPSGLFVGTTASVTVQAPLGGVLDAWVDFNINGTFDVGEQVFTNQVLTAGSNLLTFAVPGTASFGGSFARFRIATAAGDVTGPTGAAPNGEVEDYGVRLAPSLKLSEIMYNPASAEDNWEWVEVYNFGTQAVDLTGFVLDDNNTTAHVGANIAAGLIPAGTVAVLHNVDDVSAANFALAWGGGINLIAVTNWNALALGNSGDQIGLWSSLTDYMGDNVAHARAFESVLFDDVAPWPVDDGSSSIYLADSTSNNDDGANWRLSANGVAGAILSAAAGGNVGNEAGSPGILSLAAPEVVPGGTTLNDGGVNRSGLDRLTLAFDQSVTVTAVTSLNLFNHTTGALIDLSTWTLVNNTSAAVTWQRPSGLILPNGRYTAELPRSQAVNAQNTLLEETATIEFFIVQGDGDGSASVLFADFAVVGANFNPMAGTPYRAGDMNGDGFVNFFDFAIVGGGFNPVPLTALSFDFGDALETAGVPTLLANNGPRHVITGNTLFLGAARDAEADGQPTAGATGDGADDDGVVFNMMQAGMTGSLDVTSSGAGFVNAWIDFNGDGDWQDAGEQVVADGAVAAGMTNFPVTVPAGSAGARVVRVRLSATAGYSYDGLAPNGEVEDYEISIAPEPPPSSRGEAASSATVTEQSGVQSGTSSRSLMTAPAAVIRATADAAATIDNPLPLTSVSRGRLGSVLHSLWEGVWSR